MAVNISTDTNTVKVITTTTNRVTVVDNTNITSVTVSQPTTRVIKVATVGPQGPVGVGASIDTGSFATTGSNSFVGNQTIQGDLSISGSDNVNSTLRFLSGAVITTNGSNLDMTAGPGGWSEIGSNSGQNYVWVDDSGLYLVTSWDSSTQTSAWRILTGSRQLVAVGDLDMNGHVVTGSLLGTASFATTASYFNTDNLATTGSVTFTGNQIVTGSTRGNVTALTITSNTASMDLSVGNFFTLQLVSGSNTHINPSSILPGQTSILTLYTTGSATVSFPNSVKQPSGSTYTPTTSSGVDILTLASVDSSTLYVVAVKNLI